MNLNRLLKCKIVTNKGMYWKNDVERVFGKDELPNTKKNGNSQNYSEILQN